MSEFPKPSSIPGQTDPALQDWRAAIDPAVLALAQAPGSITDPNQRAAALSEASRRSGGEKVILTDEQGAPRWGEELNKPGQIMAFNGNIRGFYDDAPDDLAALNAGGYDRMPDANLLGAVTHMIIETDDGQQLMIRRTTETRAADNQTFDIASTSTGSRRTIDSRTLKDVVAVVGEPLVLGSDPDTGKNLRTRGAIAKVTAFNMNKSPVDPAHPHLARQELHRDAVREFGAAMRAAKQAKLAGSIGAASTRHP